MGGTTKIRTSETKLGSLRVQASAQGLPIPLVYGTTRVTGNMIWYGDFTAIPHTTKQKSGKGGGTKTYNTTYTYTVAVEIALMDGSGTGSGLAYVDGAPAVIWAGKEITDNVEMGFECNEGAGDWGYMQTNHPDQALSYSSVTVRGVIDLGGSDSLPNLSFEVSGRCSQMMGEGGLMSCYLDVNPKCVVEDLITDPTTGLGLPYPSLQHFYDYCEAADIKISPAYKDQKPAAEMIEELAKIGNGGIVYNPDDGLRIVPYCTQAFSKGARGPNDGLGGSIALTLPVSAAWSSIVRDASGVLVVTANGSNQVLISDDHGTNWGSAVLPSSRNWSLVVATIARLVAVVPGVNLFAVGNAGGWGWTEYSGTMPVVASWSSICKGFMGYSEETVFLFASSGNKALYLTSGLVWNQITLPSSVNIVASAVGEVYPNTRVMALSSTGTSYYTWGLFDGLNLHDFPSSIAKVGVAYGNGLWIVTTGTTTYFTSPTGLTGSWTQRTGSVSMGKVIFTGDVFVAVNTGGGQVVFTVDGLNFYNSAGFAPASPAMAWSGRYLVSVSNLTAAGRFNVWPIGCWNDPNNLLTYTPPVTTSSPVYTLTNDDFLDTQEEPVLFERTAASDAYNIVQIEILDRDNDYNTHVVEAKDSASIEVLGSRPMEKMTFHGICRPDVGSRVAENIKRRYSMRRNIYKFNLDWRYVLLEPMDMVALVEANLGLTGEQCLISEIEENEDGMLSFTVEEIPSPFLGLPDDYIGTTGTGAVTQGVNTAVAPGNVNTPVIFQPPISMTGTPKVWIGASGGVNWGGAQVWVSEDGLSYVYKGDITNPAIHGVLTAALLPGTDPDTTNTLSVDLTVSRGALASYSTASADAQNSLCYVDGELLSYSTATLTTSYAYNLTGYMRRGLNCSASSNHAIGSEFMVLDDAVGAFDVDAARAGQTLYIKLVSYNTTGGGTQNLADVTAYTYVVQPVGISPTSGTTIDTIGAGESLCVPLGQTLVVPGRLTLNGRLNLGGTLNLS